MAFHKGQLSGKDEEIAVYQKDERHSILLALARYRCVLENRCLLERNAEVLYKTIYNKTSDQVQQLIKDQARVGVLEGGRYNALVHHASLTLCLLCAVHKQEGRQADCGGREDAPEFAESRVYLGRLPEVQCVDQMRNRYAYKLISSTIHNPQLIGRVAGWAVGGDGGLAPAPLLPTRHPHSVRCACTGDGALVAVICTIISLDLAYDQLGALAPSEILVLNERHEHIMTWTHGAGLQPVTAPSARGP